MRTAFRKLFSQKPQPTLNIERALKFVANSAEQGHSRAASGGAARGTTYSPVELRFPNGHAIEGLLLDYSDTAARVRFRTRQTVPQFVTLIAPDVGIVTNVEVTWERDCEIGCAFMDEVVCPAV